METHARLEHRSVVLVDAHDLALAPVGRYADADRVPGPMHEVPGEASLSHDRASGQVDLVRRHPRPDRVLRRVQRVTGSLSRRHEPWIRRADEYGAGQHAVVAVVRSARLHVDDIVRPDRSTARALEAEPRRG